MTGAAVSPLSVSEEASPVTVSLLSGSLEEASPSTESEELSPSGGVIALNGSGSFLWDLLEKGTDEPSLVAAMLEKYDISEDVAKKDVHAFLEKARSVGLLDEA